MDYTNDETASVSGKLEKIVPSYCETSYPGKPGVPSEGCKTNGRRKISDPSKANPSFTSPRVYMIDRYNSSNWGRSAVNNYAVGSGT